MPENAGHVAFFSLLENQNQPAGNPGRADQPKHVLAVLWPERGGNAVADQ